MSKQQASILEMRSKKSESFVALKVKLDSGHICNAGCRMQGEEFSGCPSSVGGTVSQFLRLSILGGWHISQFSVLRLSIRANWWVAQFLVGVHQWLAKVARVSEGGGWEWAPSQPPVASCKGERQLLLASKGMLPAGRSKLLNLTTSTTSLP